MKIEFFKAINLLIMSIFFISTLAFAGPLGYSLRPQSTIMVSGGSEVEDSIRTNSAETQSRQFTVKRAVFPSAEGLGLFPLTVLYTEEEENMGNLAADMIFTRYLLCLEENQAQSKDYVVMNFAAAPSQDAWLAAFVDLVKKADTLHYEAFPSEGAKYYSSRIKGVHLDEYELGKDASEEARQIYKRVCFKAYLEKHIADPLGLISGENFFYLADYTDDEYMKIINGLGGVDIATIGQGENNHIGFDEAPADFSRRGIYSRKLIRSCLIQQLRDVPEVYNPDGLQLFDDEGHEITENVNAIIHRVPPTARTMVTMTILEAKYVFDMVPRLAKAPAILQLYETIELNTDVTASALRTKEQLVIFVDKESASQLPPRIFEDYQTFPSTEPNSLRLLQRQIGGKHLRETLPFALQAIEAAA